MEEDFLNEGTKNSKEAKWNLFRFQDHLLNWITISSHHFYQRDYPNTFESLTNIYSDVRGFFTKEEKKEIDKLFNEMKKATDEYIKYNQEFQQNILKRVRDQTYKPPSKVYGKMLVFRMTLMELMTKNGLTIPQVNKSSAGAASQ